MKLQFDGIFDAANPKTLLFGVSAGGRPIRYAFTTALLSFNI
jgi:hypothetical protein